jgi:hypothetical protein
MPIEHELFDKLLMHDSEASKFNKIVNFVLFFYKYIF